MTIDQRLDRLTGIVESWAASVVERDGAIESLVNESEDHRKEMAEFRRSHAEITRLLEAYLKRLPLQ